MAYIVARTRTKNNPASNYKTLLRVPENELRKVLNLLFLRTNHCEFQIRCGHGFFYVTFVELKTCIDPIAALKSSGLC